jgi:hypothetical protein
VYASIHEVQEIRMTQTKKEVKAGKPAKKATAKKAAVSKTKTVPSNLLASIGVSKVWPPTKILKRHIASPGGEFASDASRLLIAVVFTPHGEHLKEITDNHTLDGVKASLYASDYYELNRKQLAEYIRLSAS